MATKANRFPLVITGLAATVALVSCGGSESTSTDSASTTSPTAVSTASASAAAKVSANTASEAEIATALQAAGVSNPQRWAHEVVEYRPYNSTDVTLTKLRQNLAKYNPGADTLNKILSALRP